MVSAPESALPVVPVHGQPNPLGSVTVLTLLVCIVTGLVWWTWVPIAIGAAVAIAYVALELPGAVTTNLGRAP